MYRTVLVPLDGSEIAEKALVTAAKLASRVKAEVVLLYIASPDEPELVPVYQAYIEHQAERLRNGDLGRVKAHGELMGGYAADAILRYAEMNAIGLIMLASHGRSGIRALILGSVARRVLAGAKVPVWLARAGRPGPREKIRRVLVPLDGSLAAECVLPHVSALAGIKGSPIEVVLFRVSQPPVSLGSTLTLDWSRLIEEHLLDTGKIAEEYLARVAARLPKAGIKVSTEVVVGEPAAMIAGYAEQNRIDLVAIASHGHSGATRWAYGNVAGWVLSGAPCDVMLVKPP